MNNNIHGCSIEDISDKISNYKFISCDIFDTLLFRNGRCENERFRDFAEHFVSAHNMPFDTDDIWLARYISHHVCYATSKSLRGVKEPNISDIMYMSGHRLGLKKEELDDFVNKAIDIELEVECMNLMLNRELLEILEKKKKDGSIIILLSDMYLSSNFIKNLTGRFIEDSSYIFDHLFVSNEIGAQKLDGSAYKYIENILNIKGKDVIHIGDSLKSDVLNANKNGWNGCYYDYNIINISAKLAESYERVKQHESRLGFQLKNLF